MKWFIDIFFPYEVIGLENLDNLEKNFILCSNHVSNLDPLFLIVITKKKIRFLAKVELFRNFLLSLLLRKFGAIPVDRGKHDLSIISTAESILNNGDILGIFIEGTRSKTGDFLRPKSGTTIIAKHTNAQVVPVCVTPQGNKVQIFKKTKIAFGKPIEISKLDITDNYKEIRRGTDFIMNEIKKLRYL